MKLLKLLEQKGWIIGLAFLLFLATTDLCARGSDCMGDTGHNLAWSLCSVCGLTSF